MAVLARARWSDWDVAAAVQYGSFGEGQCVDDGVATSGTIDAEHIAIDAQLGFNTKHG